MSLPSRAIIRNNIGDEIGQQFINCGWHVTANGIARTVMYDVVDEGYVDTDTITAYDVTIPVSILRSVANVHELAERIEPCIELINRGCKNVTVV